MEGQWRDEISGRLFRHGEAGLFSGASRIAGDHFWRLWIETSIVILLERPKASAGAINTTNQVSYRANNGPFRPADDCRSGRAASSATGGSATFFWRLGESPSERQCWRRHAAHVPKTVQIRVRRVQRGLIAANRNSGPGNRLGSGDASGPDRNSISPPSRELLGTPAAATVGYPSPTLAQVASGGARVAWNPRLCRVVAQFPCVMAVISWRFHGTYSHASWAAFSGRIPEHRPTRTAGRRRLP